MKTNNIIIRPLRRLFIQERVDDGMYNVTDFLNQWNALYPNKQITFEEFIANEKDFEKSFGENLYLNERFVKDGDIIWMEPCLFNVLLITIDGDLWIEFEMEKAEDKGRKALEVLLKYKRTYNTDFTYTYIFSDDSCKYKIGKTTDIKKRFSALSIGNPTLKIIAIINRDVEEELHQHFRRKHIKGEWYDLSASDIDYIFTKYVTEN